MKYLEIGKKFALQLNIETMGGNKFEQGEVFTCDSFDRLGGGLEFFRMVNVRSGLHINCPLDKFDERFKRVKGQ